MSGEHFQLEVDAVRRETADARSITFRVPIELQDAFTYKAGQFLTLAVPSEVTGSVARCYSISSSPLAGNPDITVTVKRTAGGYASNWLCDNVRPGQLFSVLPPSGMFTLRSFESNLLLFAAGSGITPIMSMVRTALPHRSVNIVLFYANRDPGSVIFHDELHALARQHSDQLTLVEWHESDRGLPGLPDIKAAAEEFRLWDSYCCGPAPFMAVVTEALIELGVPSGRRRLEKFNSLTGNPFLLKAERSDGPTGSEVETAPPTDGQGSLRADGSELQVDLDGTSHTFSGWPADKTLLEFLEERSLRVPYSCREGECSSCAVQLLAGEVWMKNNEVLDDDDIEEGTRLACQSRPTSAQVHVSYEG